MAISFGIKSNAKMKAFLRWYPKHGMKATAVFVRERYLREMLPRPEHRVVIRETSWSQTVTIQGVAMLPVGDDDLPPGVQFFPVPKCWQDMLTANHRITNALAPLNAAIKAVEKKLYP